MKIAATVKSSARSRIMLLAAVMAGIAVAVAVLSTFLLYRTALEAERSRLSEIAQSQARLIEAIARFNAEHISEFHEADPVAMTVSQVIDAHKRYKGFGETGEFAVARRDGEQMDFLISHRGLSLDMPRPIPWDSRLAEPMRLALQGKSGTVIGLDYRGATVLAAYVPVAGLNMGIVAKIDLAEVRAPYMKSIVVSGAGVCAIVVLGTILFRRIGAPIVAREKAERALQQAHDMLEKTVEQRTAQLRDTNRRLRDDIHKRIQAEQALRVSEARFRDFAETASDWFWETDGDDRFTYLSQHFFDLSGMPPESILGKTRREVYEAMYEPAEPKIGNDWGPTIAMFARREPFRDLHISYVRPDGSRWYFRSNGKPVFDEHGTFLGYRGASSDITERKEIEQALTESEGRFRNFAEALPQLVFEADKDGRFTFVNRSGLEMTGYTNEDLNKGLRVFDLLTPGDRDRVQKLFDEILAAAEPGPIECMVQRKDESALPALVQTTPVFLDGNPVGFRGMVFDITKRREAEETTRRQADELAHVQRVNAMGQLSSAIAHELNQPLTATTLYLQAGRRLLQREVESDRGKVPELLDKAAAQIERAGTIIRRLREFVEKGKSATAEAAINELIEETCAIALIGARVDGVSVNFDLDEGLPPVFIDRLQIEQVLFNLVRNAIEAMNCGKNRKLTIRSSFDGKQVFVAVSDVGPGLSDAVRTRLFEPFVTTKEDGMGVGLSLSRSIVEAHEGRIWAEANAAGGMTFTFSLPAIDQGKSEGNERENRTYHR